MNRYKRELRGITGVSCVQTVNRGAYLGWVVTGVNREYARGLTQQRIQAQVFTMIFQT